MGLFTRKKAAPCCGDNTVNGAKGTSTEGTGRGIKVLGSGCAKCNALEAAVRAALAELGSSESVEHVRDFAEIAAFGVMSTPALVVDGKVLSFGRVLSKDDAKKLIEAARS